jgi:predicted GH43/DUF377 family glycosyl hydrolase
MNWKKKGLIYCPDGSKEWASRGYAHVVCPDTNYKNIVRVYYSARDSNGRCQPSFIDLDKSDLSKVVYEHPDPILEIGDPGLFDDCGIMPTWLTEVNGQKWLYYIGWTVRNTIPYHNSVGIAVSDDGVNFKKMYQGPVLTTIAEEPYFIGSSCFHYHNGVFKAWYLSCTDWYPAPDGKLEPCYHIKYAESEDGIHWNRQGKVAIEYSSDWEGGISRPSVIIEDGKYKMWYSYRGKWDYRENTANSYRIGYAESSDGINWERKDKEAGIDISADGWDSEMIEYPVVFDLDGKRIMFYNGNHFGKTGFGYALCEI